MHNAGMIYCYSRVSTRAQDLTGQLSQLKAAGCTKIFREKVTGTTAEGPHLRNLSRDTTDLLIIAREMQRAGAGIKSLAEPFLDTASAFAEIIFAILGVAVKLERRRIFERTAGDPAEAKERGVKFGRKPKLSAHQQREARAQAEKGETQTSVARSYNVSQATMSGLST
jgi:DNA invertase Pin-like site-specific DNA recombinase